MTLNHLAAIKLPQTISLRHGDFALIIVGRMINEMVKHTEQKRLTSTPLFKRYFDDGKDLVAQIQEKLKELPDDVGEDFSKAESFHRMHAAFERDISSLGKQVQHRG